MRNRTKYLSHFVKKIVQKDVTFDHDSGYSFPLFSSLLKNREEEKENELAKIVIKSHAFLLDQKNVLQTVIG